MWPRLIIGVVLCVTGAVWIGQGVGAIGGRCLTGRAGWAGTAGGGTHPWKDRGFDGGPCRLYLLPGVARPGDGEAIAMRDQRAQLGFVPLHISSEEGFDGYWLAVAWLGVDEPGSRPRSRASCPVLA